MHHHHREKIQHKHCSKVDTFFGSVSPPRKQPSAPDPNKKTPSDFPLTRIPPRQIRFAFVVRKPYARRCHGVTWDSFFGRWRCFGVSVTSKGFKFWKTNNKQMATFGGRHIQLWMVWTKIEGWLQKTTRMEFSIRQDTHTHTHISRIFKNGIWRMTRVYLDLKWGDPILTASGNFKCKNHTSVMTLGVGSPSNQTGHQPSELGWDYFHDSNHMVCHLEVLHYYNLGPY